MRTLRERSPSVHPDIVLVEINDTTIRDLEEIAGRWPWPRALSAMLIDYLHRGGAKVIAVDIGFWEKERAATYSFNGSDYTSERSDGELAEAVKRAGNVVLLADAVNPGLVGGEVVQQDWAAPPYRLGPQVEATPGHHAALRPTRRGGSGVWAQLPRHRSRRSRATHSPIRTSRARDSCHRSAWRRRSWRPAIRPEDVVLEDRAIRIGDRRSPARARPGHRCRRPVEAPRPGHDAHQLSRAGLGEGREAVSDLRSPATCCNPRAQLLEARDAGRSIPRSSRTRSCSSV